MIDYEAKKDRSYCSGAVCDRYNKCDRWIGFWEFKKGENYTFLMPDGCVKDGYYLFIPKSEKK